MSEIQSVTDTKWAEYGLSLIGVLTVIVNTLIIYIFQALKKDVEKIKTKQESDHDKIIKLESDHENNHKK